MMDTTTLVPAKRVLTDEQKARKREYKRKWRAAGHEKANVKQRTNARYALIVLLKNRPCKDCGVRFPPVCMDFDHRPGEIKLFNIGARQTGSEESIRQEAAKCDVVCANCHRIRTHNRRKGGRLLSLAVA